MSQKIAIAIIHGIGKTNPDFKDKTKPDKFVGGMAQKLKARVAKLLNQEEVDSKLAIEAIYWAPILQDLEDELFRRLEVSEKLNDFFGLRDFIFHSLADSIGYQITPSKREIYDAVHQVFADTLNRLAKSAGGKAPLCIIGHSLGSVIASNYIWDFQNDKAQIKLGDTPLEQGETLTLYYTFGSQIALWRLAYTDFGTPIAIPSPKLVQHYPKLQGEWLNFYDRDDVLGYPLKNINAEYQKAVTRDVEVNAGNVLTEWNPFSHNGYWTDDEVIKPIAQSLVNVWKNVNPSG